MTTPVVAIVGRPNVGKSTLFNRLIGKPTAIVSEVAGTTRDRIASVLPWRTSFMMIVDTGGIESVASSSLLDKVITQAKIAIEEADAIIFLVDIVDGVTPTDIDIADTLRRTNKKIILAATKSDNFKREDTVSEFYELGLGDPIPISAYHNIGIRDLLSRLDLLLGKPNEENEPSDDL